MQNQIIYYHAYCATTELLVVWESSNPGLGFCLLQCQVSGNLETGIQA